MDYGLKGKVVLVNGSTGGIGQAICRAFAREGAKPVSYTHLNRSISECSRYVGYRKRRSHRWMGQILQECSSGNNYRNGGCNSRNLAQILLMERNVIVWN